MARHNVHFKIYTSSPAHEVPIFLPTKTRDGDSLKTGYHEVVMEEKTMETLCTWSADHEDVLKVIGSEKID